MVPRGEEDEVGVAMDGEDGHYPRTINEELVELGQLPDDVDDMGDAAALLFGSNAALLFGSIGLLLKGYWSSLNCSMIQLLFFLVFITPLVLWYCITYLRLLAICMTMNMIVILVLLLCQ